MGEACRSADLADAVFDGSLDGIMTFAPVHDDAGQVVDFRWTAMNSAAKAITDRDDLVGASLLENWPHDVVRELVTQYADVLRTGSPLTLETRVPRFHGGHGWFQVHCRRFRDGDDDALVVIVRDTTEHRAYLSLLDQVQQERQALQVQALHDPLTGLANRLLLDARLEHALSRLSRQEGAIAVVFLDVDRLKEVNDRHGHRVGDLLITELAHRLVSGARPYDTVARVGGDEFVVVCEDVADGDIPRIARRLLDGCTQSFEIEGHRLEVSASVGVAITSDAGSDPVALIDEADQAMYRAKQAGGGRVEFPPTGAGARLVDRDVIDRLLPDALARGELALVFDPIARANDLRIVAADARVRWEHPERGRIEHATICSAAEGESLLELQRWMLSGAIEHLALLEGRHDPALAIVVDVSERLIEEPGFRNWLAASLDQRGVRPERLGLGIDDHYLAAEDDLTAARIAALAEMGVLIERVGVGAGTATRYARFHPIRFVRLAPGLVDGLGRGTEIVVGAIMDIGHSRDRTMLAGDISTAEQLDMLRGLGIDLVQGSHLHDLLTADELCLAAQGSPAAYPRR